MASATPTWNPPQLTWLITGASSGFGLELARVALSHGHTVIATSRNPARIPDLVEEVEAHAGSRWLTLNVDDRDCGSIIDQLESEGVTIDVLVNNAGFALLGASEVFSEDEVRRQMETSFFGPYRLIRAAIPHMRRRRRGMLVNLGSGAGVDGRESMSIYGGSKSALDGLVRVMAKEVAHFNIRCLTVQLGAFRTNFGLTVNKAEGPLPDDYAGTQTETVPNLLGTGNYKLDGDPHKAAKAIYEVVMGEGVGVGKESERILPLGRDLTPMMDRVATAAKHTIDTFREVCNNVYYED